MREYAESGNRPDPSVEKSGVWKTRIGANDYQ